jgi:hypothetical protein
MEIMSNAFGEAFTVKTMKQITNNTHLRILNNFAFGIGMPRIIRGNTLSSQYESSNDLSSNLIPHRSFLLNDRFIENVVFPDRDLNDRIIEDA